MKYQLNAGVVQTFAQKYYKVLFVAVAGLFLATLTATSLMSASADEIDRTVTESGQFNWVFDTFPSGGGNFEFTADAARIGAGSLFAEPITNDTSYGKFIAYHTPTEELDQLSGVSYDFQIGTGSVVGDANEFYLNLYTILPETTETFYSCRFDYVPSSGSVGSFTNFEVDRFTAANVVTPRGGAVCPSTLDEMPEGSVLNYMTLNMGDTSVNDQDVSGYFDNVVIGVGDDTITYDFEPATTPTDKDECKKGGWMSFNSPAFKNQGQCVSFVASQGRSNR